MYACMHVGMYVCMYVCMYILNNNRKASNSAKTKQTQNAPGRNTVEQNTPRE
jgi:hypothetical protein